jgi:hypothetical protein
MAKQPKPGFPTTPENESRAKDLMRLSESKKRAAYDQQSIGEGQIKNKVKEGNSYYPVGKERLKIANDMRLSAKLDSLQAVRLRKK